MQDVQNEQEKQHKIKENNRKEHKIAWIQSVMIMAAVLLIVIGCLRNETAVVWTKATNICMECIGIG